MMPLFGEGPYLEKLFGTDEQSEMPKFGISPFNGVSEFKLNLVPTALAVFAVEAVTESLFYSYRLKT